MELNVHPESFGVLHTPQKLLQRVQKKQDRYQEHYRPVQNGRHQRHSDGGVLLQNLDDELFNPHGLSIADQRDPFDQGGAFTRHLRP